LKADLQEVIFQQPQEVMKTKITLPNKFLQEMFCNIRKGGMMSLNKVGHDLSHIKGILAIYYPTGNQSAFSQAKMRYS
jgi:hypothetical protein